MKDGSTSGLGKDSNARHSFDRFARILIWLGSCVAVSAQQVPKALWSIASVSSEEIVGSPSPASAAIDGNPSTFWHTQWFGGTPPPPHQITINLGGMYSVTQVQYLPRQDFINGRIKNYQLYLSQNGTDWGQPVAEGMFVNSKTRQLVNIPPTAGRYLRLRSLSSVNGDLFATIGELDVVGEPVTIIANNTPDSIIDFLPDHLTIAPGRSLNFAGFGMDVDADEPFSFAWDFGRGSGLAPTISQNPGPVRFFIPGQFKVTMAVTDAKGAVDATPDVLRVSVTSDLLDSSHWSLKFVDSEETAAHDGAATHAFDGDPKSFWLSQAPTGGGSQHELQIDLGASFKINGIQYIPRQASSSGRILNYYFFASDDGANWGDPSAYGTLSDSTSEQIVGFAPVTGRFISLMVMSAVGGEGVAAIGEIGLFGKPAAADGGSSPGVFSGNITDASEVGRVLLTASDSGAQRESLGLDGGGVKALYDAFTTVVSREEAEAGTSDLVRLWTAERVGQAISALSPGLLETGGYALTGNWDFTGANVTVGATSSVVSSNITDASMAGRALLIAADATSQRLALGLDGVGIKSLYETAAGVATQEEAEAGASDVIRMWTPERVGQAIAALSPEFSQSGDYTLTGNWDFTGANVTVGATSSVVSSNITDATDAGRLILMAADNVAQREALGLNGVGIKSLYESASQVVSREDAEAGVSDSVRMWTPERVGQAIAALAPAGACTGCYQTFALTIENVENGMNYGIGRVSGSGLPGGFQVEEITAVHAGAHLAFPQVTVSFFHGLTRNGNGVSLLPGVLAVTSTTSGNTAVGLDQLSPVPSGSWIWIETSGLAGTTGNLEISISGRHIHE